MFVFFLVLCRFANMALPNARHVACWRQPQPLLDLLSDAQSSCTACVGCLPLPPQKMYMAHHVPITYLSAFRFGPHGFGFGRQILRQAEPDFPGLSHCHYDWRCPWWHRGPLLSTRASCWYLRTPHGATDAAATNHKAERCRLSFC